MKQTGKREKKGKREREGEILPERASQGWFRSGGAKAGTTTRKMEGKLQEQSRPAEKKEVSGA